MYRSLVGILFSMLVVTSVFADGGNLNNRLKGDYLIATNRVCAQSRDFGPDGQALINATQLTTAIERVNTYDGEGNVTSVGHTMQVNSGSLNAGQFPVSEADFTCSGTYQVNEDGSFSETQTCAGTVLTGSIAGQTFTRTAGTITGQIRGEHLLIKDTSARTPVIITFSGAGSFQRLCGQTGSGVKLKK